MIRRFEPGDTDRVLAIWEAASRAAHPFLDDGFFDRERAEIAGTHLSTAETWVAEPDGTVVGFISLLGDEIGGLFVDPAMHGEGVGRALVDHAVAGRTAVELDVFEDNLIGRRFYGRYGFEAVGRHRHEATGRMQLRLRYRASGP